MAITLTGSGGLFVILGKQFHAQATINTARGTTIPAEVEDAVDEVDNLTKSYEVQDLTTGLAAAAISARDNDSEITALQRLGSRVIIQLAKDDNRQPDDSLGTALVELRDQMEGSGGETNPDNDVDASAGAVSVAVGGSNTGDGVVVVSATLGSGRNAENTLAENIEGKVTNVAGTTIRFRGEEAARSRLAAEWPKGSGSDVSLTAQSGGILANGGMDDEDDRANTPDDWVVEIGTIGTTVLMSDYEVQTVIISSDPTEGDYVLTYTSVDSDVQRTGPIDWDATGSAVQAALRKLQGLSAVTVVTTGTSPNFTHTITFNEMDPPGTIANLSSTNTFDVGSIAHANVTQSTAHVYRDKALIIDSNGSELTAIRQDITASLSPRSVYAFNAYMKVDAYPAAGVITVRLVDGAGTVINNAQGVANSFTINPLSGQDLSTSAFTAVNGFFQTPTAIPEIVYLEIKVTTAISNTASLYIDEVTLVAARQLYAGGPFVAVFAGMTQFGILDEFTITTTNDRAGLFQEWFYRNGYGGGSFLLPSNSAGGETIDDALIS